MISETFKCNKTNSRYAVSSTKSKINYTPSYFGFKGLNGDGSGVKICIIDTGYPRHSNIKIKASNIIDFTGSKNAALDVHGHATGVVAIIKASGSNMTGLAPKSEIYYAKGLGDEGEGSHGSVQAALLYAIVKRVDIIVMSFGSETKHPMFHDVIKKANKEGICMFASAGRSKKTTSDSDYPARFPEIMSVGHTTGNIPKTGKKGVQHIFFPSASLQTAYLDNRYIKMSGTSISAPVAAGLAAIILQKSIEKGSRLSPKEVYDKLMSLCRGM